MRNCGWIGSTAIKLVVLLCLPFFSLAQSWNPRYVSMTYSSGGYYEYLPVGYNDPANANKKYPVILFIHGVGEQGSYLPSVATVGLPGLINSGNFPSSFNVNGQNFSFIVIAPQFQNWPEPTQISNMLDYIQANYRADASRLYLTGLSMGGGATWDYASASASNANRLAAILPVCGASNPNSTRTQIIANANLPVLATHNDFDGIVSSWNTKAYVDGINSFYPNPMAIKLIWPSSSHNAWDRTYNPYEKLTGNLNAYEWLLQYSRGSAAPPPSTSLSVSISSTSQVSCFGMSNGSATANAGGGTAPYSYSWNTSPQQTNATANNLAAGTYTVTVRDAKGASASTSVTINQPSRLVLNVTPGTITTMGGTTTVSVSASGGTGPYTFNGPMNNVSAGTYVYSVTDAMGCTDSRTITISNPTKTALVAMLSKWKDVSCYGGSDGSATMEVTGGVPPYSYSWNTSPVQTALTATNLRGGSYVFTVRDAENNSVSTTVNIGEAPRLSLNVQPGTITTAGGTTSVNLYASGGTSPYTFSGGPTTNVKAGTYTYTVTDAAGCTQSKTVTITDLVSGSLPLSLSMTSKGATCFGSSNGSATVSVTGGTLPYTYSWNTNPAQTGATATNLTAGNYTVTVTDADKKTATASVYIDQPGPLILSVTPGTITQKGGTTDVALSAVGGWYPYTFSGPTTNVKAGTYDYSVRDVNGCTDAKTVTITEQGTGATALPISLSITSKDISCFGGSNGSATVSVAGGTAPFTYSWNTNPVQTGSTAANLSVGNYSVTVTDANKQTSTATVYIEQPGQLILTVAPGTITVNGGRTDVALSAVGGWYPYTFTGPTSNVKAGTYTYSVKDVNGCTDTKTVTITEPAPTPALTAGLESHTNVSCAGNSDGSASVGASGGSRPYTYSWNTSPVQTGAKASNLKAGSYVVTITDANNASVQVTVNISEPSPLVLDVKAGSIAAAGGTTSVELNAMGGTAPYTFTGEVSNLKAGTYTFSVRDANGCTDGQTITISEPAAAAPAPAPAPDPALTISAAGSDASCFGTANGSASATAAGGAAPYSFKWSNGQEGATASGLSAGTVSVTVTDAKGRNAVATVTIGQPPALELSATAGQIITMGGTTSVSLQARGGTQPYTYSGATSGLSAGTYTYTVTDAKGCSATRQLSITQPDIMLSATAGVIRCNGGNTSASLRVTGGVAPFTFTGDTVALKAGTYQYAVTDAAGHKAFTTLTITEPQPLELNAAAAPIMKVGGTTNVELAAKGGTAPYAYSGAVTKVSAGIYAYTVTDANSCQAMASIEVKEPGVKLESFDLKKADTAVDLQWSTSYEYQIDHFEIERSTDKVNYTRISSAKSLSNVLRAARYFAVDGRPTVNRNFYRISAITVYGERIELDQRDLFYDGRGKIMVKNMAATLDISLENLYLEPLQVTLFDMNGRPVATRNYDKQTYLWNVKFNMQGLPSGSYVLGIQSTHVKYSKQVIKP